jgi:predicted PurR-regulated permease PerM
MSSADTPAESGSPEPSDPALLQASSARVAESNDDAPELTAPHVRSRTLLLLLVVIALLYTCYLASELIVPILLAVFLALCGNPIVAGLKRLWIPRWLGALLLISGGISAAVLGASVMLTPASDWIRQAPTELREHLPKLRALTKPIEEANRATETIQQMTDVGTPAPTSVRVVEPTRHNLVTLLTDAPRTLASILAVVFLSFFFLIYGDSLARHLVTVTPGWRRKRITVTILRAIQTDISRYMLTVTAINLGLAGVTAAALWLIGLDPRNALLWGSIGGLLNFAPYVGPLVSAIALTLVGLIQFDALGQALLVPGAFLLLHLIESQFVTPLVLGRRMAISPVIVLLWLFLWGWMWGIAGLLLAVPMLVCFKICCDRVEGLRGWATMMEP